jgi:hypothetical protein
LSHHYFTLYKVSTLIQWKVIHKLQLFKENLKLFSNWNQFSIPNKLKKKHHSFPTENKFHLKLFSIQFIAQNIASKYHFAYLCFSKFPCWLSNFGSSLLSFSQIFFFFDNNSNYYQFFWHIFHLYFQFTIGFQWKFDTIFNILYYWFLKFSLECKKNKINYIAADCCCPFTAIQQQHTQYYYLLIYILTISANMSESNNKFLLNQFLKIPTINYIYHYFGFTWFFFFCCWYTQSLLL